jgi:molybdopterin-guanine dinucleotide biosynthesis protein A
MPDKLGIVGCILAGGLSRRMGGRDKPLIPLGDRPMIVHVSERLSPQVSCTIVNANGDPSRYHELCVPVVPDRIEGNAGPLAGVSAALAWCAGNRPEATHLATAAADTPFFPKDLVLKLAMAAGAGTIVLAASGGRHHPVFGLWPIDLREDLEHWMEETDHFKVMSWVRRHEWVTVDFEFSRVGDRVFDPFFNANTPEELADAEALLLEGNGSTGEIG